MSEDTTEPTPQNAIDAASEILALSSKLDHAVKASNPVMIEVTSSHYEDAAMKHAYCLSRYILSIPSPDEFAKLQRKAARLDRIRQYTAPGLIVRSDAEGLLAATIYEMCEEHQQ